MRKDRLTKHKNGAIFMLHDKCEREQISKYVQNAQFLCAQK